MCCYPVGRDLVVKKVQMKKMRPGFTQLVSIPTAEVVGVSNSYSHFPNVGMEGVDVCCDFYLSNVMPSFISVKCSVTADRWFSCLMSPSVAVSYRRSILHYILLQDGICIVRQSTGIILTYNTNKPLKPKLHVFRRY